MKKRLLSLSLCLLLALGAAACSAATEQSDNQTTVQAIDSQTTNIDLSAFDLTTSDRDADPSYDASTSCSIVFSQSAAAVSGDGAAATGTTVTITAAGTYLISGGCQNGQIIVNAGDEDKVQLVLTGLALSSDSAPLLIQNADKVFLTLDTGSVNELSDGASYTLSLDDSSVDAAIFSKADLTINGSGSLTVTGNYQHGIVSKDDLVVTGGTLDVTAASTGIEGKDCVKLVGGTMTVTAGTNGIRSTNAEEAGRGFILVDGATVNITAGTDGMEAITMLDIASGTMTIQSGGGSANASTSAGWGIWGQNANTTDTAESDSAKGLKCDQDIVVFDGTITVDSSDDAIHSNDSILISGGTLSLQSGDDGVHADLTLTVQGGTLSINKSYEGLEAGEITISEGTTSVVASDDGLNAAGGNDQSSMSGRPGENGFSGDSSQSILISGGYLVVNASGDGLDSNGSLTVTGGVTLVSGPTNSGNGALDYNGSATISGGVLLAAGSSGMAESFDDSSTQGSIMTTLSTQSGGTPLALYDSDGTVLVSFIPAKGYQNVVVSVPSIASGETYTLCTGTLSGADENGYGSSVTLSGATTLATITMTALHYSSGGGTTGGPGGGGMTNPRDSSTSQTAPDDVSGATPPSGRGGQRPDGGSKGN